MCKIRYLNSVHLKVLVSSFNLRGRRPLTDFVQELEKKMLRRVYSTKVTSPFRLIYSVYDAGGLRI